MDNMENFVKNLQTVSLANQQKRKDFENEERRKKDDNLREHLNKLESEIKATMADKMNKASEEGLFEACLLTFDSKTQFDDYKTIFLVKGPLMRTMRDAYPQVPHVNTGFFQQRDIVPLMDRLKDYTGLYVFLKYHRDTKSYSLNITWVPED